MPTAGFTFASSEKRGASCFWRQRTTEHWHPMQAMQRWQHVNTEQKTNPNSASNELCHLKQTMQRCPASQYRDKLPKRCNYWTTPLYAEQCTTSRKIEYQQQVTNPNSELLLNTGTQCKQCNGDNTSKQNKTTNPNSASNELCHLMQTMQRCPASQYRDKLPKRCN